MSESLLCDLPELTDFRYSYNAEDVIYGNKILDIPEAEIRNNELDCSSENLRRRNYFIKDKGYSLNTDMFFPVEIGEIDDLAIDSTDEELSILRKI